MKQGTGYKRIRTYWCVLNQGNSTEVKLIQNDSLFKFLVAISKKRQVIIYETSIICYLYVYFYDLSFVWVYFRYLSNELSKYECLKNSILICLDSY